MELFTDYMLKIDPKAADVIKEYKNDEEGIY